MKRFWSKVAVVGPDDCWLWLGGKSGHYGIFNLGNVPVRSHQVAFFLHYGRWPSAQIDHRCRNKLCCNPTHLREATYKQNQENLSGAHTISQTGLRGVVRVGNRYRAVVKHNGMQHHAGYHATAAGADLAARSLRLRLFTHNTADER